MGTPKEILASNILPRIGLREPIYIEALKRLHFDRNNDVIYPMENLQKEKVSNVIKEWMEKQVILERNAKNKELLKVENLSFSYPNKQKVLENVNLLIYEGEIVALLGHNGAGKSTLAHSLIGINKMKNGKIALKGEDISSWSIRKRGKSYLT